MSKKALVWGGIFGFVAPFVGIFAGLQISTVLGNVLAFPLVGLAYLTNKPFGMWSLPMLAIAVFISIVIWACIFGFIAHVLKRSA